MLEWLILASLGAQRLWLLWHQSEIFRPVREWMTRRGGKLAYLANCTMCTATWAGIIITGVLQPTLLLNDVGDFLVWSLATTAGIGIVDTLNAILGRKAAGQ